MDIQPLTVQIPEAEPADLQAQLARTRWPNKIVGADWAYGTSLAYCTAEARGTFRIAIWHVTLQSDLDARLLPH